LQQIRFQNHSRMHRISIFGFLFHLAYLV
jgi:hypothetical protein